MLEGFEQLTKDQEIDVWISPKVGDFLNSYREPNGKDVRKVLQILRKLGQFGTKMVGGTEFFKHEGKFKTGRKDGSSLAVYAVKSFQLRLYGGFLTIGGRHCFLAIEAVQKKRNKADRTVLERVAAALGEFDV